MHVTPGGTPRPQPVKVWLTKGNITVTCRIAREDETVSEQPVRSLSLRGAQREITGWLADAGYQPAGRWTAEAKDDGSTTTESSRVFRPGPDAITI